MDGLLVYLSVKRWNKGSAGNWQGPCNRRLGWGDESQWGEKFLEGGEVCATNGEAAAFVKR